MLSFPALLPLFSHVSVIISMLMQTAVQSLCPPTQGSDAHTVTHFTLPTCWCPETLCLELVVIRQIEYHLHHCCDSALA